MKNRKSAHRNSCMCLAPDGEIFDALVSEGDNHEFKRLLDRDFFSGRAASVLSVTKTPERRKTQNSTYCVAFGLHLCRYSERCRLQ